MKAYTCIRPYHALVESQASNMLSKGDINHLGRESCVRILVVPIMGNFRHIESEFPTLLLNKKIPQISDHITPNILSHSGFALTCESGLVSMSANISVVGM